MEQEILLHLEQISKSFPGVKALDHVSIDIKKGEVHALVGENGAGKSTLMNIISGNYKADEGSIFWKGKEKCAGSWNIDRISGKKPDRWLECSRKYFCRAPACQSIQAYRL